MSYILDALRRAESERERERHQVPDVHAAQLPHPSVGGAAARGFPIGEAQGNRWPSVGITVGLLALAAVAAFAVWRFGFNATPSANRSASSSVATAAGSANTDNSGPSSTRGPAGLSTGNAAYGSAALGAGPTGTPPSAAAPSLASGTPQAAVPPGMVAQIAGPPVPAQAAAQANARALEAAALPPANAEKPLTPAVPRGYRAGPPVDPRLGPPNASPDGAAEAPRGARTAADSKPTVAALAPPPAPLPAPLPAPVVPLSAMAPELRLQIPPMAVGGTVYSDRPANRFVMINGQVVREGESPAAGVTLERIGPKSAVMRWREVRFEMPL